GTSLCRKPLKCSIDVPSNSNCQPSFFSCSERPFTTLVLLSFCPQLQAMATARRRIEKFLKFLFILVEVQLFFAHGTRCLRNTVPQPASRSKIAQYAREVKMLSPNFDARAPRLLGGGEQNFFGLARNTGLLEGIRRRRYKYCLASFFSVKCALENHNMKDTDPSGYNPEFAELEKQLRCPAGKAGLEVAQMMNESNLGMTLNTIDALDLRDLHNLLEIGHGNCGHLETLLSKAHKLEYVGLDISETMFEEAQRINRVLINKGKISFKLYDGTRIPFDDGTFDRGMTVNTIYFWTDPDEFIREIARI